MCPRELVKVFAALMGADSDAICNAAYGERTTERVNRRNAYRERTWDTRAGTIALGTRHYERHRDYPVHIWWARDYRVGWAPVSKRGPDPGRRS